MQYLSNSRRELSNSRSHNYMVRAEGADPPYGQPDRKKAVFFDDRPYQSRGMPLTKVSTRRQRPIGRRKGSRAVQSLPGGILWVLIRPIQWQKNIKGIERDHWLWPSETFRRFIDGIIKSFHQLTIFATICVITFLCTPQKTLPFSLFNSLTTDHSWPPTIFWPYDLQMFHFYSSHKNVLS